jgi:hypothetical protein
MTARSATSQDRISWVSGIEGDLPMIEGTDIGVMVAFEATRQRIKATKRDIS